MKDISRTVARLISDATISDAQDVRSDLFDRYMGEKYGDEKKGKSQFVSTDVFDAIEAVHPDIMDVFTSAEDIAEFDPVGMEDEEAAKQETTAVSHMFWQKNKGFEILTTWTKEALMQQISYVRFGWEDHERVSIEEYADLTADELLAVLQQIKGDVEVLEQEIDEEAQTTSVKLRITSENKKYVIECIPQEEMFVSQRWGKLSLEGVPCCGHRREMERGELVAMGFSEESIDAANDDTDEFQTASRHDTEDLFEGEPEEGEGATKKVTVYEAYLREDRDEDGKAELLKVWAIGDGSTILKWEDGSEAIEEVSHVPFACLTPLVVPHRHVGRSVAELVDDIAQVKTVLLRTTLDNVYATQYGRPVVNPQLVDDDTYNDIANPAHGAPIRYQGDQLAFYAPPSIAGTTLPMVEAFDSLKETRTGATRYNQGLDAESLNKTASGISQIMNASQKKTKLIARTFAETGIRDLFLGIHRDLRAGPMKEITMKLRGKWVSVNPRTWKDRTDMTVNIGMGKGDRDEKRQGLMLISQAQEKLMAAGSRMVNEANLFATAERMAETYGFESVEPFFNDPRTLPPEQPQPQQPDPSVMLASAQIQNMNAETQRRAADDQAKHQLEARKLELQAQELELKRSEMQRKSIDTAAGIQTNAVKLELERDKAINADDLARDKMEMDALTGALDREAQAYQSTPAVPYEDMGE